MNKTLVIMGSLLYCVISYGMEQNQQLCIDDSKGQSHKIYDCEKLKNKYPTLQGSRKEANQALEKFLLDEVSDQFHGRNNNNERNAELLACLICHGANPNKVVRKDMCNALPITYRSGRTVTGFTPVYTCPLQYAVRTDNPPLVSFLLQHKAHANISWIMRLARVKTYIDTYVWPIKHYLYDDRTFLMPTRYNERPLFSHVRSVAVAQELAPYVDMDKEIKRGGVVVKKMIHPNFDNIDLFRYVFENTHDLANIPNDKGKLPLHRLAESCERYFGKEELLLQKASILVEHTDDINALDDQVGGILSKEGKTSFQKTFAHARQNVRPCKLLEEFLKVRGGKVITHIKKGNPSQEIEKLKE